MLDGCTSLRCNDFEQILKDRFFWFASPLKAEMILIMHCLAAAAYALSLIAQLPSETPQTTSSGPVSATPGTGLTPLRPEQNSLVGLDLRSEPSDQAPSVKTIGSDDQITFLRSQGPWYEIDLKSTEGLEFRGWVKADLASARRLPEPAPIVQKTKELKPLTSEKFVFFWDKRVKERGSLKISSGLQQISYSLSGVVAGGERQNISPGYNFYGGHFALEGEFVPMTLALGSSLELSPTIRGSYAYGLHRVSFSNPFTDVPEISGQAYSIDTHSFLIEGFGSLNRTFSESFRLQLKPGLGYFYHEVSPDLDPIPGGSELVFVEQVTTALTLPVELSAQFLSRFYASLLFRPLVFTSFKETPEVSPKIKLSGFSWMAGSLLGWRLRQAFALELGINLMDLKAKGSGAASRLGNDFEDGEVKTKLRKAHLGIRWIF